MSNEPPADLRRRLRELPLLTPEQSARLDDLARQFPDARDLGQQLVKCGWLTAFQLGWLNQGRGRELFLGPFVLLDLLGKGGLGQVFRARHQTLNRVQAVKLIAPHLAHDPAVRERFLREARALADLAHPHIVTIFDAGAAGDRWYLAMELVEGMDLHRLLRQRGTLPVAEACQYARQAALALDHAHGRGWVHRDVKPSNLLWFDGPDGPCVKLADLGLAGWLQRAAREPVTPSNVAIGTPDYLAPEQALDARQADARSDIYSLGCTLYHLLAGCPPFPEGTPAQKMLRHLNETPAALVQLRTGLPEGLVAAVQKMMAREPAARFASAAEVARTLAPFCTAREIHQPTTTSRPALAEDGPAPSTDSVTRPPPRRRPVWLVAGLVCLLGLGVLVVGLYRGWMNGPGDQEKQPSANADQSLVGPQEELPEGVVAVLGERRWRHWDSVEKAVISRDGRLLALAAGEGRIHLWDARTGRELHWLADPKHQAQGLALTADGRFLATGGNDPHVRLWRKGTEWSVRRLAGHTANVTCVAFSPGGERLASDAMDRKVKLWKVEEGTAESTLDGHADQVLASGCGDGAVRVWDLAGKPLAACRGHTGKVTGLAFSPDGKRLVSAGWDATVRCWDCARGKQLSLHEGVWQNYYDVVWSPLDGELVYLACQDGLVRRWEPRSVQLRSTGQPGHEGPVRGLVFLGDRRLVSCGDDHTVRLWDVWAGKQEKRQTPHRGAVKALAVSPDGKSLATGGNDERVCVWDLPQLTVRHELDSPNWAYALGWAPGGRLVHGGKSGEVRLVDGTTGKSIQRFSGHRFQVTCLAVDPKGQWLATGDGNWEGEGVARLWPLEGGSAVLLKGHKHSVEALAWARDGKMLAAGDRGGKVRLWSRDGKLLATVGEHDSTLASLSFSRDGRWLASCDLDGHVTLRAASSGEARHAWKLPGQVPGLAFSSDCKHLASANGNGTIFILRLPQWAQ
jgi:serine/threonine-protein kinase